MTITQTQADAISGYLQRIGFQGHIFDPNDHDESVHLISIPPSQPFWIFSFKPSTSPRVINGGNMFTYGVAADSFDMIVTSQPVDLSVVSQGMKTLKQGGLVCLCVPGQMKPKDRAVFTKLKVEFTHHIETCDDLGGSRLVAFNSVLFGIYKGGM